MNPDLVQVDTLWIGALIAIPVAALIALVCRIGVRSPATRHALWLIALLAFVAPSVVSMTGVPAWIAQIRAHVIASRVQVPEIPHESALPEAEGDPPPRTPLIESTREHATFEGFEPLPTELAFPRQNPSPSPDVFFTPIEATPRDAVWTEPRVDDAPISSTVSPPAGPAPTETFDAEVSPTAKIGYGILIDRARAQLMAWSAWGDRVVSSLGSVPPVSGVVWLLGALLAVALLASRIMLDRHTLRQASPPSIADQALLRRAADQIALKRPPPLRFVARRVSPMVTCGPRRRLVIPRSLWDDLDEDARLSVLLHELAHIKRRDHWTHWLCAGVGLLYWWHPLVWLVRSRLADEADLACDAWVTSLMPGGRRVYATALLRATSFVSEGRSRSRPRAGASLAMAASSTRRLSRRLTMVMTHSVRPRLSATGTSVVGILAVLALIVLPGFACPPDEKEKSAPADVYFGDLHEPDDSTFDEHMRHREDAVHEEDMTRLMERLHELETRLGGLHEQLDARRHADLHEDTPHLDHRIDLIVPDAPSPMDEDDRIDRLYIIPGGRLEALSALMVRSDVPILVTAQDEGIVVHASRRDQDTFARFAAMICPEGVTVIDTDSGQRSMLSGQALRGLRTTSRVGAGPSGLAPLAFSGPGVFAVVGSDDGECEKECAEACVGDCGEGCEGCDGCEMAPEAKASDPFTGAGAPTPERRAAVEAMRVRLRDLRQSQQRLVETARVNSNERRVHETRAAQMVRQADRLSEQADREEERADQAEEAADEMSDEADARESDGDVARARSMRERAEVMRQQSRERRERADVIRTQSDEVEAAAERASEEAERVQDMVDEFEEAIEELSAEIEALEEELTELARALGGASR
ncbi:MAG: M56 family metallopeptidase [Phycisphaerales bacterium]